MHIVVVGYETVEYDS